MELVLSPGRIGGENNTGSPFHNQEVREWSHVDRLTGMLEHARIETGRWEARHHGTAQAYGKVIDSRERNSADGNVVQKARRQVEVFQSQGIGGRSVQVVRASQWSSSRITDSSSSSPVSVSMNDVSQLRNGNEDKSVNAILSGPDESMTKLSQVSRLCRQINGDTIQKNRLSESPVFGNRFKSKYNAVSKEERNKLNSSSLIMNSLKSTSNEDLTKSVYNDPKTKSQTIFTRDCKARRSLQIPKSVVSEDFDRSRNDEMIRVNPEGMEYVEKNNSSRNSPSNSDHDISVLKNDRKRVKSYVLGMEDADSESVIPLSLPKPIINEKKILFNGTAVDKTGKEIVKSEYLRPTPILLKPKSNTTVVHLNNKLFIESEKNPIAENDTVKNLIENQATAVRSISTSTTSRVQSLANRFSNGGNNLMSINGKIDSITSQNIFSQNTATFFGKKQTIVDSSSRIEGLINRSAVLNGTDNSVDIFPALIERKTITDDPNIGITLQGKPVKKVGFCKTEVHFAAESGKVNIVETDCKPPPSNRFRRRRRNSVVTNMPISVQNKNLPLIHFGDTSYEKYIFGQSNGQFKTDDFNAAKEKQDSENKSENDSTASIKDKAASGTVEQRLTTSSDELNLREGWRARLKTIIKSEPPTMQITIDDDCNDDVINLGKNFDVIDETIVDHSFKGSLHTTTVNLGANVISKIQKQRHTNEGECNTISTGIQLQFNTKVEKVTPGITSGKEIKPCITPEVEKTDTTAVEARIKSSPAVVSTEKNHPQYSIVVSTISKIPRPLIQTQQSVLKSAHLVMNINKIRSNISSIVKKTTDSITLSGDNKFTNKYENNDKNNSLNFKHLISSLHENCSSTNSAAGMIFRERDNSADFDMVNNNYTRNNTSTLITVNANNNTMNKNNKIITNGNTCQTSRFTPLRLKNFNDRLNNREDDRRGNIVTIEDRNTCRDNNQLQYSSGSEQADEEVRSYMLGSKIHRSSYKVQNKKFTHSARSVIETEERCRRTGNFNKSNEEHSSSTTVKENWDNDDLIDNTVSNETTIDDELDNIISSDLPAEEEVFFEANGTVEKNHILTGEMMNENNVVTSDNENNKVLMNIVTTHEPVIARVEDSRSSPVDTIRDHQLILSGKKLRSNSVTELLSISEKNDKILRENQINRGNKTASASSGKKSIVKPVPQQKSSKDDDNCDNKISGKELSTRIISNDDSTKTISDPTYVNVFENAKKKKKKSVPIYENYRVIRNKNNSNDKKFSKKVITRTEMNAVTDREMQAKSATNGNPDVEVISLPVADDCEEEIYKQYNKSRDPDAKLTTISESNTSKRTNNREVHKIIKPAKTRSKKIVRPPSSTSSIDSVHRNSANENPKDFEDSKPLHAKSTRSSRLHRVTSTSHESSGQENGERYTSNDDKKTTSERTSNVKLNRSNQVVLDNTNTTTTKNDQVSKNFNDNTRSKKPIEIVYQTAVFNMKNEKLAKSSRSKESKTPRYINDLICGSKPRRSTDARHVKGTAASLSQQRAHHKSTSPTNRHWK